MSKLTMESEVQLKGKAAKLASFLISNKTTAEKNIALKKLQNNF